MEWASGREERKSRALGPRGRGARGDRAAGQAAKIKWLASATRHFGDCAAHEGAKVDGNDGLCALARQPDLAAPKPRALQIDTVRRPAARPLLTYLPACLRSRYLPAYLPYLGKF
jgi:hypothetical protein